MIKRRRCGQNSGLTSSQWSTHAKAHNLLDAAGVENKNSLLPAGAIYDLRTAGSGVKASQSWVGYRVFNSYVMDKNALADANDQTGSSGCSKCIQERHKECLKQL